MILAWMIIILMLAGFLSWLVSKWNQQLSKWIALVALIIDFGISLNLWMQPGAGIDQGGTWLIDYRLEWIPSFGISFHLALDGLSTVMLLLTFFLGILAVLCSWSEIRERTGFYFFNLLWTLAGITGVFVAMDLFLFYFFWEVMLVPMYFLISIWGDTNRRYASYKFFIFTQAGGLLMLLAILALYFIHGGQTGIYSYDYFDLLNTDMQPATAKWIMLGFLAFAATASAVVLGYLKTREFVRKRLRYVEAVHSSSAPFKAGGAAMLLAAPVVWLLPIVGAPAADEAGVRTRTQARTAAARAARTTYPSSAVPAGCLVRANR